MAGVRAPVGYPAMLERFPPSEVVELVVAAEEAGFDDRDRPEAVHSA